MEIGRVVFRLTATEMTTYQDEFEQVVDELLSDAGGFLDGLHANERSFFHLTTAVAHWGRRLRRSADEAFRVLEPCVRQSMLMTLIPAKAVSSTYMGSIDLAIKEHAAALQIGLTERQVGRLRDICLNVRKLRGLSSQEARNKSMSLGKLKSLRDGSYDAIRKRQSQRCIWCGASFGDPGVFESLEHVTPKHIGDDVPDGSNWALACLSCNQGKADALAWAAHAAAHDYMTRMDFSFPHEMGLPHRWVTLRRDRVCFRCRCDAAKTELHVYRRVATGLPIPANCGITCRVCAQTDGIDLLAVRWAQREVSRGTVGSVAGLSSIRG